MAPIALSTRFASSSSAAMSKPMSTHLVLRQTLEQAERLAAVGEHVRPEAAADLAEVCRRDPGAKTY